MTYMGEIFFSVDNQVEVYQREMNEIRRRLRMLASDAKNLEKKIRSSTAHRTRKSSGSVDHATDNEGELLRLQSSPARQSLTTSTREILFELDNLKRRFQERNTREQPARLQQIVTTGSDRSV